MERWKHVTVSPCRRAISPDTASMAWFLFLFFARSIAEQKPANLRAF